MSTYLYPAQPVVPMPPTTIERRAQWSQTARHTSQIQQQLVARWFGHAMQNATQQSQHTRLLARKKEKKTKTKTKNKKLQKMERKGEKGTQRSGQEVPRKSKKKWCVWHVWYRVRYHIPGTWVLYLANYTILYRVYNITRVYIIPYYTGYTRISYNTYSKSTCIKLVYAHISYCCNTYHTLARFYDVDQRSTTE